MNLSIIFLITFVLTLQKVNAYTWHEEVNLFWAETCDWVGNDLSKTATTSDQCGQKCASTSKCSHFTWTKFNGGTCWMKQYAVLQAQVTTPNEYTVCGYMKTPTVAPTTTTSSPRGQHIQWQLRSGSIPSRGVNLGGWLVAENWMTGDEAVWNGVPSAIAGEGEYQTMLYLGHAKGDALFDQHRSTWIQESDIQEIASFGLNTVRVPIGYWICGFDNFDVSGKAEWQVLAPGALKYLDLLINNWALKHNVAVLINIHAAKGSQNGKDHSAAPVPGQALWSQYAENVNNTVALAKWLAARYRQSEAFLGIGLLNEPESPTDSTVLKNYYIRAHNEIRATGDDCVLIHSPLLTQQGGQAMADFTPPPQFSNFWHDWHPYFLWGYDGQTENQLLDAVEAKGADIAAWTGNWLFIGEWSLAHPGSAPFTDINRLKLFSQIQVAAFSKAHAGWTFWAWKVSGDQSGLNGWSMRANLRAGIIKW